MKESIHHSVKKINVLRDRIDVLLKLKRRDEAIQKCKKLFHLTTSFAVILLLNENHDLFADQLENSLLAWDKLMLLHSG
jgi:hypothetical protein